MASVRRGDGVQTAGSTGLLRTDGGGADNDDDDDGDHEDLFDEEDNNENRPLIIPISSVADASINARVPAPASTSPIRPDHRHEDDNPAQSPSHSSTPSGINIGAGPASSSLSSSLSPPKSLFRSRHRGTKRGGRRRQQQHRHTNRAPAAGTKSTSSLDGDETMNDDVDVDGGEGDLGSLRRSGAAPSSSASSRLCQSCASAHNLKCMNCVARVLVWFTMVSLSAATFWYSYELFVKGINPHQIAWFSAGAFVLLGFPISMYGIVTHLANYNQPQIQVYVVRILWMVPIYSIESWLAMRFHKQAIYIETLRDLYESYVLYSFLQFLIQVLGGEQALILMLKDKSPTRGVHMWGFEYCLKPWLMGQPVRKTLFHHDEVLPVGAIGGGGVPGAAGASRAVKRVHWKSPFFIKCKFGVLQYVLLKFLCAVLVLILEYYGLYKEGDFSPRGGYLYICIITNTSQCWALYCLIFFYYATKTELAAIRPVGKFLSVKALVFFTWWQSVFISVLYQFDMIPHYQYEDWTPEDVAKAFQDYLICIEMFLAAVVHTIVFPHTEYTPQAVEARRRALNQLPMTSRKRLGRHSKYYAAYSSAAALRGPLWKAGDDHSSKCSSADPLREVELATFDSSSRHRYHHPRGGGHVLHHGVDLNDGASSFESEGLLLPPSESWEMAAEDQIMMTNASAASSPPRSVSIAHSTIAEGDEHLFNSHSGSQLLRGSNVDSAAYDDLGSSDGEHDDDDDDGGRRDALEDGDVYDDDEDESESEHERDEFVNAQPYQSDLQRRVSMADAPHSGHPVSTPNRNPGFVSALIDSAIPLDLRDSTVGLVKGDYRVERKTLLHHATTSDNYDLFSQNRRAVFKRGHNLGASSNTSHATAESSAAMRGPGIGGEQASNAP